MTNGDPLTIEASAFAGDSPHEIAADELMSAFNMSSRDAEKAVALVYKHVCESPEAVENVHTLADVLRFVLLQIESKTTHAALEARCYRFAFGFRASNDESLRATAAEWGVSPEAVSKRVAALRKLHGLGLNSFNKPAAAAQTYRLHNRTRKPSLPCL